MSDAATLSEEERALVEAIDGRGADMIARVKQWSEVNSGSRNPDGLETMRVLIHQAFDDLNGKAEAVELEPAEIVRPDGEVVQQDFTPAYRLTQRPDAPIQIVMTGHLDTVFPEDSHFQKWELWDEDTLNGPGVADMKGGLIVLLEALRAFEQNPNRDQVGYTVLISPDEEIGSPASRHELMRIAKTAHLGMTYEPALANGDLAGARKGSGNFSLVLRGKAAHAGREHHLGRNAVIAGAKFAAALDALNGEREGVIFNIGKIEGGGAVNIVPDLGIVRFNVRMPTPEDMDWAKAQIERLADEAGAADGITASLHGGFTRPPKPMAPPVARVFDFTRRAGAAIGLDINWNDTGGVCEGNNLWASGCPNVDTLGVRGGDIHSDQEFVKLSSFTERAKLSAVMLMKFASGEFDARGAREA